jgi:DNA polymerase-3 subunit gamma/tau
VTDTLRAQLTSGRLSHAYLFTGTRGTGKTSCAKILAKAVNCENLQNGDPCNVCPACRAIDAGSCLDVQEIDAASNNGVDSVRILRDDAIYTPGTVKKRVYIIDEVHMLSTAAFNALLKIIEEPPEHLLFILATTELHKVPATILSRCQRFSFRRLLPEDIAARLNYVAYQEKIELEPDAAQLLARLADGALRDGLSLLDQCASASEGPVTAELVYRSLGLAGDRSTAELLRAVAAHDSRHALTLFSRLYAEGKDLPAMLSELCALARDLLLLKLAPGIGGDMISGVCTEEELAALLPLFTQGELLRVTALLQETASGFNRSANRRVDAELCLIRLCDPALDLDAKALNARLTRLEERVSAGTFLPPDEAARETTAAPEDEAAVLSARPAAEPVQGEEADSGELFWPELVERLQAELKPPALGFFSVGPKAPVTGVLQGQTLQLLATAEVVRKTIDKPEVLEVVRAKAALVLGRAVTVRVCMQGSAAGGAGKSDKMKQLLEFGGAHRDIINIQE